VTAKPGLPISGLVQLLASVILLSSAWPLTKIALAAGTTPLWFAEGRAVLSGVVAAVLLGVMGKLSLPRRADFPAMFAISLWRMRPFPGFPLAGPPYWPTPRRSGWCRFR
jgi:O-acetylserine/cysteine efflux transporter